MYTIESTLSISSSHSSTLRPGEDDRALWIICVAMSLMQRFSLDIAVMCAYPVLFLVWKETKEFHGAFRLTIQWWKWIVQSVIQFAHR